MPFTPYHMGPGLLFKSLLQGSFSLMVFGWTQIMMDLQPLWVLVTGEGHLHGFSHTFLGATLIAIASAITGRYLAHIGLRLLRIKPTASAGFSQQVTVSWCVACVSALLGGYSHVLLDSIMHSDVEPFYPLTLVNPFLHGLSVSHLHKLCVYSGLVGASLFYGIQWYRNK